MLWVLLAACAPPPLSATSLPSIEFIFPESRDDIMVCPNLMVSVDVDNWEVVNHEDEQEAEEEERRGHWHLRDAGGEYLAIAMDSWAEISLGAEEDFDEPTLVVITAHLANHDHNELNTALYPDSTATAEFVVSNGEDCIGGGSGSGDGMPGY